MCQQNRPLDTLGTLSRAVLLTTSGQTDKVVKGTTSEIIRAVLKLKSGTQLQKADKEERDAALRKLKEKGLSVRQIERLTGINRGVVLKA